ncbi:MAG: VCBS repeat-containing protein, partial [Xanthomonadales bacterium]|nr:VCBS repeat-containing protein [Xanthomonadales bacterium]
SIVAGDFDEDGDDDLVVLTLEGRVLFVAGEGDGSFASPDTIRSLGSTNNTRIVAARFGDDAHLDIALSLEGRDQVVVLFGDGNGAFLQSATFFINDPIGLVAGRFSGGDSELDLAVVSREDRTVTIFEGDSGDFDEGNTYAISSSSEVLSSGIATGDFDGDGDDDLVALNRRIQTTGADENAVILFGANNGVFAVGPSYDVGFGPNQVEVADLNRDGLLDLAVASSRIFSATVVLGDGTGGFGTPASFPAGGNPLDVAIADFDANGAPDLVAVNQPSDSLTIYLNTCNCLSPNQAPVVSGATAFAQQGSPAQSFLIATASDPDGPDDALTARVLEPTTFSISGIVNTNGVFTADVAAACATPVGMNDVFIEISDGCRTTTATLQVDVTANTPPIAPNSASTTVPFGASFSEVLTPLPSDNGTFTPSLVIMPDSFTGSGDYDPMTGVVTINDAGPVDDYSASLTLTDQCGLQTEATYGLNVVPATTQVVVNGPARTRVNTPTPYSFELTVAAPGAGAPTGTVTLSSGSTTCQVSVPTATNTCELTFDFLGPRTVSATFASADG